MEDSRRSRNPLSVAHPNLLALRLTRSLANRAIITALLNVIANKTLGAPPPSRRRIPPIKPLLIIDGAAALLNVLLVELAQVVAEVVAAVKRVATPCALGIVAVVGLLLRGRCVLVLVVPVEVGAALEWFGVAAGMEADYWVIAA
jgi:hypothetical protein